MPNKNYNIPPRLRAASVVANSFNETDNTVEVIAATDAEVLQVSWDGMISEVLSMDAAHVRMARINNGAPALDNHARYGSVRDIVVGVVVNARLENGKLITKIQFSDRADLKDFIADVKKGILRNISIGYRVYKYEVTEEVGKVPIYRAVDWEPFEVSFVPVPADYMAGVRSDKTTTDNSVEIISTNSNKNNMKHSEILQLVRAAGLGIEFAEKLFAIENITDAQVRSMVDEEKKKTGNPTPTPAPTTTAPSEEQTRAASKAERKRSSDILNAVRAADKAMPKGGFSTEYAETLINDENMTADQARAAIFEKMSQSTTQQQNTTAHNPGVTIGGEGDQRFRSDAINGMVLRSGQVKEKEFKPEELVSARSYQGMSLLRFAASCLQRSGVDISTLSDKDIATRAITSSTSDFPVVLENVLNKILLSAYQTTPDTWRQFCMIGSVTDFRAHKRLRPGSLSKLDSVGENGELKNKPLVDAKAESITAGTKGNIINISRNMIINDDLGYFSRVASDLGRAAVRTIEEDVYALLASNPTMTDGVALFHATHANLVTGAAPSVAAFDAMRVKMAQQKDHSGNEVLDIRPSILLLGVHQGGDAKVINGSQYDPDAANKLQRPNKVYGLFSQVIETARITGNEQYAFADPSVLPVIEVAFLNGVQTPYLEQEQAFEQLGLRWRVYTDYGVGAIDWKGAVKNPGA